jgi:oligopeptide/dipeptide ABC transporter ATP-binding protein
MVRGSVRFRGRELSTLPEAELSRLRGAEIALIFQEPSIALNPVICVGDQVTEVIRAHRPWEARRCRKEAESLLARVRLPAGGRVYHAYPHELSGGQNQRVLIAQALACGPSLIIADEPMSGLDAETQAGILELLLELKTHSRVAFLFISHHPGVLARLADRLLVMYAGQIVEEGSLPQVFRTPRHPYTQGLLHSLPAAADACAGKDRKRLVPIRGAPPDMNDLPPGCAFAPRCPLRMDICDLQEPQLVELGGDRQVRCFAHDN